MIRSLYAWFVEKLGFLIPSGGLAERTITGGIWTTMINLSDRGLQIIMVVVLARLLDPSAFGLLGIALLSVAVMKRFTRLGLDTALIQNEEENVDAFLGTVWMIKIARGVLILAIAYVAGPYVAAFFDTPAATDVFRVVAVFPLIIGLRNPYMVYFRKDLEFHKEFVYRVSGTIIQVALAIVLAAFVFENVWALVIGNLAGHIVRSSVSYLMLDKIPPLRFEVDRAWELFDYGKWMTGFSIFSFLFSQGDDAFVGWFLGATALGFYQMAYRLSRAPATEITHSISMTMLSSYSKMQNDLETLRSTYFKVLKLVITVTAPMAVGIAVVASDFVTVFLGSDWIETIALIQVLAIWGYLSAIGATSGPLLKAIGRPDYLTRATIVKTILLAVLIYPAAELYGVLGVSVVVVGSAFLTSEPYITYCVMSEIDATLRRFAWTISIPTVASIVMGASVLGLQWVYPGETSVLQFVLGVLTGAISYAVVLLVLDRVLNYGIWDLVTSMIGFGKSPDSSEVV